MSQLGAYLKTARESKKMSLDEIQEITKIRKVYLQAIEDGELERLPGAFYVRAFTKSYCEVLGLSFQDVATQYKDELALHDPAESNEPSQTFRRERVANFDRIVKWGSSLIFIVVVAIVVALVYLIVVHFNAKEDRRLNQSRITNEVKIYVSPTPSPSSSQVASVEPSSSPSSSPSNSPTIVGGEVTLVGTDSNSLVYNVEGVNGIELTMSFTEDCWTLFRDQNSNGELIKGKLGKSTYIAGDTETLLAKNNVYLRFGNVKGVQLTLNGTKLDALMLSEEGARNIQINLVSGSSEQ